MKTKAWRLDVGFAIGLIVGVLMCRDAYDLAAGLLQKPQLAIVSAAMGILVVIQSNKWRRVGRYRGLAGRIRALRHPRHSIELYIVSPD